MTQTPNWPLIGRTASSRVAQTLAHHATWQLTQVPQDYGLPLAACLENRSTALLVMVANGDLAVVAAGMERTLLDTRSDLLLIAKETHPWFPPLCCIGSWRSGQIRWHQPLLPWSSDDKTIWLVPAFDIAIANGAPAFRLIARCLTGERVPWSCDAERLDGLDRAAGLLRRAAV